MAIQFNCPGCRQPVEVDDEWAGQHVACPFCQRVVTAPSESTINTLQHGLPPTGRKLSPMTAGGAIATDAAATPRYNRLAVVGFGLSLGAILSFVFGLIMFQFVSDHVDANASPQEMQKKMLELAVDPEYKSRIFFGSGLFCMSFSCWLAGVIVSVIAMTRKNLTGHRLAIAGIACSVLLPFLVCAGPLLGL